MNSKQKELVKVFIFLFILSFIVINWNDVSWIFNYKELSGLAYDFFNPYQENTSIVANAAVIPGTKQAAYSDTNNTLEIPAINLTTSVVIGASTNIAALENQLDKGVVYYPGSVLPGEKGEIVILGHSAP